MLSTLQFEVSAQTTSPIQPAQKIPIQAPSKAQDFIINLDGVASQSFGIRKNEPNACERIRKHLDQQLKLFHEYAQQDMRTISSALASSTSANVATQIPLVVAAIKTFYDGLNTDSTKNYDDIEAACKKLGSVATLATINDAVEDFRAKQLTAAKALVKVETDFESTMQAFYKPVEDIIRRN